MEELLLEEKNELIQMIEFIQADTFHRNYPLVQRELSLLLYQLCDVQKLIDTFYDDEL